MQESFSPNNVIIDTVHFQSSPYNPPLFAVAK